MVEIKAYGDGDLEKIIPNLRQVFKDEIKGMKLALRENTHALSIWNGSDLLAIIGGHPISSGVLQAWALISNATTPVAYSFTKSVRLIISQWLSQSGYHRMQFHVRSGWDCEMRWAKLLGFECEGLMKKYGPDRHDCWLYGRVV